jgi:hypothetical protein
MATIEAPERDFKFLPSYQIFFGGCKSYKSPVTTSAPYWHEWSDVSDPSPADYDRTMHLSLHKLLLNWSRLPRWVKRPECESAVVGTTPKLGNIKSKAPDFTRWSPGAHQVSTWIGCSRPSEASVTKQRTRWVARWLQTHSG